MAEGGEASFSSVTKRGFEFFCELCIDDGKQVEAEGYCVDCREYLCKLCFAAHKRTRSTRHHVLRDKSNMPKETPLSTDRVNKDITTKCKVHSGKPVEYYCKSHAVLGCSKCFVSDHGGCSGIEHIVDISEKILESQLFRDLTTKIQLIQQTLRDTEARARENKTVSQRCCEDVVLMVRMLKAETIVMLNEFEKDTVALAEKIMLEDGEKMETVVKDCKVVSEMVHQLSSEFESLQSSKRVCQLYVNMRTTESEVMTFQEMLRKLEAANVVRTFTFRPNAELTSLLRGPDVWGTLSHHLQQDRTASRVTDRDPSSITANRLADVCIRSSSDKSDCWITGTAVVSNNRLVITDAKNCKVKLVDTHTNTLHSELSIASQPWDVTVFDKTQAAVTFTTRKKILVMKVSPSLTQEREITVHNKCRGIAFNQDRLLVTYESSPRLDILDLQGNVIKIIETVSDGNMMFEFPWYVCVSSDNETIYVSDSSRGTVTSLTCDGVVKALYLDEMLKSPYKMCTDHHDNVYVCGCLSKNIHMITADCKKCKVILTQADGLDSHVCSVSHCRDTDRLFVGMEGNVLKTYQLS